MFASDAVACFYKHLYELILKKKNATVPFCGEMREKIQYRFDLLITFACLPVFISDGKKEHATSENHTCC